MIGAPNPARAALRYQKHAEGYDESCRRTEPLRRDTIAALRLSPGDRVLDAASGTGMSFALLERAIGPEGRLIGVELSTDMMQRARAKVAEHGWQNTVLIESTIEEAAIPDGLDAVLCFYTHDVMRSERALARIFASCRQGARVAVAGMKYFPWWLAPLNLFALGKAYPYMTTFEGLARPWDRLLRYVPDLVVRPTQLGMGYIGHGTHRAPAR